MDRSLRCSLLLLVALLLPGAAPAARAAKVYLTMEEALELAFPECSIERTTAYLTKEQRKAAAELAGFEIETSIVHAYVARREGRLVGRAYFDTHRVRTLKQTIMVVVDPQDRIRRLELLAFAEPEDYVPRASWYGQFPGKRLDGELALDRGIKGVTGATLTARATTDAARRVLALHAVTQAPPPAQGPAVTIRR